MKLNRYFYFLLVIAVVIVGIQTANAQPPPPPPGGGPPCWPPPCIPVDNGIIAALVAAVGFGAIMIFRAVKLRAAGK
jgi:hypothetical protein